jgi:oxygen-independent coproporphyrinogen-3 oxidase
MSDDRRAGYGEERLPRYTRYPTSPHFSDAVSRTDYARWLAAIPANATASLYLHIPFCRAMCWYCGCHTTVALRQAPISNYLTALRREIELVAGQLTSPLQVRHVHFGGGTPTIVEPEEFEDLVRLLRQRFLLSADAEVAIEIDPRALTRAMTAALGRAGVNRASLGVQSFDPKVQRAVNRVQSVEQTQQAILDLRAAGVGGINIDLIYGLPHQTIASCIETVERCLALRPDRFSVFGYAHVPSFKKHQRKIAETALPDGPARQAQAEAIAAALVRDGYRRIGLDHYALPDDPMTQALAARALHRNFQGYTTDANEILIGLGASAIGRLPQGYVQNDTVLGSYAGTIALGELATARGYKFGTEDRLRAHLIERVMCDFSVDVEEACSAHGLAADILVDAAAKLKALEADGLIRFDGARLTVVDEARDLVRVVASAFDAHLGQSGRAHSRAV